MATTLGFKDFIDLPKWRAIAPALSANGAGKCLAYDHSGGPYRHPFHFYLSAATILDVYSPLNDEWITLGSPALAGTFGAGAVCDFHPSQGPRGTIAAGATTTSVTLSTVLPATVAANQLANEGRGYGVRIRIIGSSAGGSGKTETRTIVGNTAGTAPQIWVDTPFTFTPAAGDTYEILAGRLYMLSAGALAAGVWKYYDVATNSYSASLATTNLPATIGTDSSLVVLAENHVSNSRTPGNGFFGTATYDGGQKECIQATASSSTTITGSAMPSDLAANEYRNFQVRIVEDATTPTSVGQRRRIASHTSGAAGVFTVAAFAVTPSATAKFVVENDDDKILLFSSATTVVYNYSISGNAWDTTTWAAPVAHGAGVYAIQSFGITRDVGLQGRHSNIFRVRGGAVAAIDVLDIAGGATGVWTNDIPYTNRTTTFTTGTSGAYDPWTLGGRYFYLTVSGTQRHVRFDMLNRTLEPGTYLRYPQSTAVAGCKSAFSVFEDGATKISQLTIMGNTLAYGFSTLIQR